MAVGLWIALISAASGATTPPPDDEVRASQVFEWEAFLQERRIPAEQAERLVVTFTRGIRAPARARAEKRAAGWTFDRPTLQVERSPLLRPSGGERQSRAQKGASRLCTDTKALPDVPSGVRALPIPTRPRPPRSTLQTVHTISVLRVSLDGESRFYVDLEPGDSATLVEVYPPPGARASKRSREHRQLRVERTTGRLTVTESPQSTTTCVHLLAKPVPEPTKRPTAEPFVW